MLRSVSQVMREAIIMLLLVLMLVYPDNHNINALRIGKGVWKTNDTLSVCHQVVLQRRQS